MAYVCNDCGKQLVDDDQLDDHIFWEFLENGGTGSYHVAWNEVQVGTKTVDVKMWVEPYDEKVKSGHWEYK